jgi:long-chain fatty acid transport protein
MKMTRIALAVSATIFASSAMATNGTNMTGVGAQSSAMGGTGVAAFYGAENVVVNPAMIGKSTGTEFSFGGTLFTPDVSNNGVVDADGQDYVTSTGDTYVIPTVSLTSRIDDSLTFGIGMYGTSGMGVDYSANEVNMMTGSINQFEAQSNLQIMRFVPTLAFNKDNFGIGFSPVIQYGALDINYTNPDRNSDGSFTRTTSTVGKGAASDLGMGYSIGGFFDIQENLTVAASYTSAIDMQYDGQLSTASAAFVNPMTDFTEAFSDHLEQPAELKAGIAYKMDNITLTGDFKQIKWGDAKGYSDFGWEDQNVISVGAKYQGNGYWLGAGYNKADNPIKQQDGTTYAGAVTNMFNNVFFPAISEQHFSLGGGYNLTKNVAIDAAVVISPEEKVTADLAALGMDNTTTKHSQAAYTMSVRYNF